LPPGRVPALTAWPQGLERGDEGARECLVFAGLEDVRTQVVGRLRVVALTLPTGSLGRTSFAS
jgi:hypothetical protein